jgi:hypothetical protein
VGLGVYAQGVKVSVWTFAFSRNAVTGVRQQATETEHGLAAKAARQREEVMGWK